MKILIKPVDFFTKQAQTRRQQAEQKLAHQQFRQKPIPTYFRKGLLVDIRR